MREQNALISPGARPFHAFRPRSVGDRAETPKAEPNFATQRDHQTNF
jgi:hypothetical protein